MNIICKGTGDVIQWLLPFNVEERGMTVTDLSSGNALLLVLTITALPINDKIIIACYKCIPYPLYQLQLIGIRVKGKYCTLPFCSL